MISLNLIRFIVLVGFNSFHASGLFLYSLKTSENQKFSDVSGGIERDQWHEME